MWGYDIDPADLRPRPCGRGGFKLPYGIQSFIPLGPRPCGRGGFKPFFSTIDADSIVPARVGGVDLSNRIFTQDDAYLISPPVWAGWI